MSALRVAITIDALALDPDAVVDVRGVLESVAAVEAALAELGHHGHRVAVTDHAAPALAQLFAAPPDLVFNLCEAVHGRSEGEPRLIAALELAGIPVTGASAELTTLARRKDVIGALLAQHGLPVPRSATVDGLQTPPDWTAYPCIVKPATSDGSIGITQQSVARAADELPAVLERMRGHPPLLLQELLTGREFNVGFVGQQLMPLAEIEYRDVPAGTWPIMDYPAKWEPGSVSDLMTVPRCPAALDDDLAAAIAELGRAAWQAVGGVGVGRVDIRADAAGQLYILEVNPNPDLTPGLGIARMAGLLGWSYSDLVARIIDEAMTRIGPRREAASAGVPRLQACVYAPGCTRHVCLRGCSPGSGRSASPTC